jgi:hypothetical protein
MQQMVARKIERRAAGGGKLRDRNRSDRQFSLHLAVRYRLLAGGAQR